MARDRVSLVITGLLILTSLTVLACNPATIQKGLKPHYRLLRPEGAGPFPALMLVPGCSGLNPSRLPKHCLKITQLKSTSTQEHVTDLTGLIFQPFWNAGFTGVQSATIRKLQHSLGRGSGDFLLNT